jgi:hypothetical protein
MLKRIIETRDIIIPYPNLITSMKIQLGAMKETNRCLIATAFQLGFGKCH